MSLSPSDLTILIDNREKRPSPLRVSKPSPPGSSSATAPSKAWKTSSPPRKKPAKTSPITSTTAARSSKIKPSASSKLPHRLMVITADADELEYGRWPYENLVPAELLQENAPGVARRWPSNHLRRHAQPRRRHRQKLPLRHRENALPNQPRLLRRSQRTTRSIHLYLLHKASRPTSPLDSGPLPNQRPTKIPPHLRRGGRKGHRLRPRDSRPPSPRAAAGVLGNLAASKSNRPGSPRPSSGAASSAKAEPANPPQCASPSPPSANTSAKTAPTASGWLGTDRRNEPPRSKQTQPTIRPRDRSAIDAANENSLCES